MASVQEGVTGGLGRESSVRQPASPAVIIHGACLSRSRAFLSFCPSLSLCLAHTSFSFCSRLFRDMPAHYLSFTSLSLLSFTLLAHSSPLEHGPKSQSGAQIVNNATLDSSYAVSICLVYPHRMNVQLPTFLHSVRRSRASCSSTRVPNSILQASESTPTNIPRPATPRSTATSLHWNQPRRSESDSHIFHSRTTSTTSSTFSTTDRSRLAIRRRA